MGGCVNSDWINAEVCRVVKWLKKKNLILLKDPLKTYPPKKKSLEYNKIPQNKAP